METKQLFRLCHLCGTLNEGDSEVLRCTKCGKGFLPLNYFEKIRQKTIKMNQAPEEMPEFGLSPLPGLVVFW